MKKLFLLLLVVTVARKISAQVNLQTGSATFSLPMFSWQDDKSRLNSVVALNYNSGNGLKVSDVASNVGQGWNLLAGGQIIRIQAGEPDDQKPRDGASDDITKYPAGYLYDPVSAITGCPGALVKYPIYEDKNRVYKQNNPVAADKEMDHFAFQINGRNGIFVLQKNANNGNGDVGVFLGDTKMKVWFTRDETMISYGIRTTINAFFIQDENGLIYKFTKHELTKVTKANYCDANHTAPLTQPDMGGGNVYHEGAFDAGVVNPYVINGWYLTEIEDVLTHRVITIAYEASDRSLDVSAGTSISYYGEKDYALITHARSITKTPVLSTITYPDGHVVTFNYGRDRVDLVGDKVLASVDIQYNTRNLARYELNTIYFILNRYGEPVSDFQKKNARLCLRSVKKIGVDLKGDDPPYVFDYYTGSSTADDIVPPPFYHLKDIWGYYNGNNNNDYWGDPIPISSPLSALNCTQLMGLCFVRNGTNAIAINPKPGYAKNGLLKQIEYPTGGAVKYSYVQNAAQLNGQNTNVGGVHVSQVTSTDGGYSNDCTNPLLTNYSYNASAGSNESSMWGVEMPANSVGSTVSHYAPESKHYHWGIRHGCFPLGCCQYKYQYPGILSRESAIDLTGHQKFMETLSIVMDILGASLVVLDAVLLACLGTGQGYGALVAVILDIIASLANLLITCFSDYSRDYYTTAFYNSDINSGNPLPVQYKRVEVTESSGTNGKTVVEFTSPTDHAVWEPTNTALSSKQRFAYWAYGLPKKTTVYDASGNLVKQTENVYDFTHAKTPYTVGQNNYPSCKCLVTGVYSQRNTNWEDPAQYNSPNTPNVTQSNADMKVDIYPVITGRVLLSRSYERTFKPGNTSQYLENTTEYTYNANHNFDVNYINTTLADGTITGKRIKYNSDFAATPLTVLTQNNITSVPVDIIEFRGESAIGEKVSEFSQLANGDIKPSRVLDRRFSQPYGGTEFYYGPGNPLNPADLKEAQSFTYNTAGNLIGMKDEGDRVVANIYDYNNKYVVASVINAEPVNDKAAYTSFETSTLGSWTLTGASNYVTTNAVTGSRSFGLSGSNSLSANLNTAKGYLVSFWSSNSSVSVSGAALVKSAPTINGFTYYEYTISQGASSVTLSSSSSTIDELRLYPQTSRMRTVSYDPLVGKTAECDENNRITYYEYDNNGRLRVIKDDNQNIIKMYEYNVAGKKLTGACVTTYANFAISEKFASNNCPAGTAGSEVTYTIAAGTYTSTVSQAYVDMLAQNELNELGQAYANTNATCATIYYNAAISQNFTKQGCPVGYTGTTITYTVPAGKYSSIVDQAHADHQAQMEIDANGQAFANAPGNASCVIDHEPDWIGTGLDPVCEVGPNGNLTGHQMFQVIDQNPNSPTYNQTQWTTGPLNLAVCLPLCPDCGGLDQACILTVCETGTRVCTKSVYQGNGQYYNEFHYEFSDGSWSPTYTEVSIYACW